MAVFTAVNANQYVKVHVLNRKITMWIFHDAYHALTAFPFVRTQA